MPALFITQHDIAEIPVISVKAGSSAFIFFESSFKILTDLAFDSIHRILVRDGSRHYRQCAGHQ
jgi:hypothetical protein